jgi:hypothetical protein
MDWPATALGAASLVVSIVVAWRQQRLARRQEELVERSQASRVWVRFKGFDVARWPDGAPKVFADEEGRRHHSMDGWTCRVFNDSEAPIFEVSVEAIFDGGSTMLPVGELGPGSSSSIGTDEEIIVEEPMRRLRLELRFRVEAGLYWLRDSDGRLVRTSEED